MSEIPELPSLDALKEKIDASQKGQGSRGASRHHAEIHSGTAAAMRFAIDLLAGVIVGVGVGFGLDSYFGTLPVFSLICLLFGAAGGFLTVWRNSQRLLGEDNTSRQHSD